MTKRERLDNGQPEVPSSYSDWVNLVHEITGGELVDENDGVISMNEPLVKSVKVPSTLKDALGNRANVRILGDMDMGYTIRARGRWPTRTQISYHVVPRGQEEVLLAAEITKSPSFLFRPRRFEDDFTPAPKKEAVELLIPELEEEQLNAFVDLLRNTAVESTKQGLDNPDGEF